MGVGANIGAVIAVFLIIVIIVWAYMYYKGEQQKLLDKGCIPETWDSFGFGRIWSCPAGVKP